ncbi:SAVED domain-containing protein [Nitrincola sp. MINF-07-Sa-05]|uniref:SAVED domain-containing protein n=1 Tax=Nitrincola salilacus TaxID=3400273 RepID=UPI00391853B8
MSKVNRAHVTGTIRVDNLDDQELASWLDNRFAQKHRVAYLHSDYLCKVVDLDDPSLSLHPADPQIASKASLKKLVPKHLLFSFEMPLDALQKAQVASANWKWVPVRTKPEVDVLVATRDGLLGRARGRGPEISEKTAQKVWADAGGRCMFEGCGEDLSEIPLWTKAARVGYMAHIIASDPEGPRGTQMDSHRLADNSENIMLMCDAHHRLIDSFASEHYSAAILNEMRQAHRDIVRNYLNSLSYPRTRAVTLHANLANVPTYFHDSELIDAILAVKRAMVPGVIHYIRRKSQRDDRHLSGFWCQYLREHEGDIRQLVSGFNSSSGAITENLAIFPLHHIPTLILAGRIMGEAQSIQIFQYDKVRSTWAWDRQATPHPPDTFSADPLPQDRASEVLITIELTALVDDDAIPPNLQADVAAGRLPWIRIRSKNTGFDCITHPEDLDQYTRETRRAIVHVQDVMRVQKVHLIAISPASTVFRFGQMLQAGHHPEYLVYDRAGRDYKFTPAMSITGHQVSAADTQHPFSISLR